MPNFLQHPQEMIDLGYSLSKRIDIAITNRCNARCPQCDRTDPNGLGAVDWLPIISWPVEKFIKYFPKETLDDIEEYGFTSTWGDSMMAKDIEKICHYIIDNSKANVLITTNGSLRNEEFYWNLGVYCGERLTIIFDIDGTTEEMHQKYRRGTSLKKSLDHMYVFSQTKGKALSQTILFKHNQEYKKDILDLVKKYGSANHEFYPSDRFENSIPNSNPTHIFNHNKSNRFYFINEKGEEEYLEAADDKV